MDELPTAGSGEDQLIARYFRPLARHPGAFGLEDDAAVLVPPFGFDLVLKTDAIIAGVHFFADDPPDSVGCKALRVNLSDLAAKGAKPSGFLLSLALPAEAGTSWVASFADGLGMDADRYDCPLLGGDTDRTPGPLVVSIAVVGVVPSGAMVRRSGAKPGDAVFVSGTIGDAALGLKLRRDPTLARRLRPQARDHLVARYLRPEPRVELAPALLLHASAAMDVSDGLAGDLAKLCRASRASAEIDIQRVPFSDAAREVVAIDTRASDVALTGGDDYEVLCTVSPERIDAFKTAAADAGVPVTEIGCIVAGEPSPAFRDGAGRARVFETASFSHF